MIGGGPETNNIMQVLNNLQILNATTNHFVQTQNNIFMQNYNNEDIQFDINLFWFVFNRFFQFRNHAQQILTTYPNLIQHAVGRETNNILRLICNLFQNIFSRILDLMINNINLIIKDINFKKQSYLDLLRTTETNLNLIFTPFNANYLNTNQMIIHKVQHLRGLIQRAKQIYHSGKL